MDGERFDSLVKRLTQTRLTRWEALRGVLASAVVGLTGAARAEETAAKKPGKQPKRGAAAGKHGGKKGGCRANGQACQKNSQCCSGQCDNRVCIPRLGCLPDREPCQQNSECCTATASTSSVPRRSLSVARAPPPRPARPRPTAAASSRRLLPVRRTTSATWREFAAPRTARAGSAVTMAVATGHLRQLRPGQTCYRQRQVSG